MKIRNFLTYTAPIVIALILLAFVFIIGDLEIVLLINKNRPRLLDPFFVWFTNLGDYIFGLLLIMILILSKWIRSLSKYRYAVALAFVSWVLLDLILTNSLKVIISRPRPYVINDDIESLGWPTNPYQSFPSGHTVTAFSFSTAMFLHVKRRWLRAIPILFSILMGVSRIYCGVHYPTDVIFGALIGIYGTLLIDKAFKSVIRKREKFRVD